jgi:hypothetical protein
LIDELGYLMGDAGGVTVACEDVTSFNKGDDRVVMCRPWLGLKAPALAWLKTALAR